MQTMQSDVHPHRFLMLSLQLFLFGFIVLFLELSLIRYLSANIWNLGYFPNFVLIATFFGMGLGFSFHHIFSNKMADFFYLLGAFFLLVLITFTTFDQVVVPGFSVDQSHFGNLLFFTQTLVDTSVFHNLISFCYCFFLIAAVNFCICVNMAKLFKQFKPLTAYTLDILGSCAGIIVFSVTCYLSLPASVWFACLGVVFLLYSVNPKSTFFYCLAAVFILIVAITQYNNRDYQGVFQPTSHLLTRWSPYQKVQYYKPDSVLLANNIPHQTIQSSYFVTHSFYILPYQLRKQYQLPPINSALILGAGSGNDVVAGLLSHVQHIDAVEIDPVIADVGKNENPYHPYQNVNVTLHVTDGRKYLSSTHNHYSLIEFALTDSVVRAGSLSQLRLENYLFTKEALEKAYQSLTANGQIYLYNYYRQPWIVEKIETMLHQITGHYPKVIRLNGQFYVISIGKKSTTYQNNPNFVRSNIKVPTDNWPYLYLKYPSIPAVYLFPMFFLGALVVFSLYMHQRSVCGKRSENIFFKVAFLLMGAAFLLLETKGILQFSLLFGNTWFNNALVFFSVLVLILLANWIAYFLPEKAILVTFPLLIIISIVSSIVPMHYLLGIASILNRYLQASLLIFSPLFFANLVFGLAFKRRRVGEHLFAWNLLGAIFGGIIEYSSMLFGYQALTLLAGSIYVASFGFLFYGFRKQKLTDSVSDFLTVETMPAQTETQ